MIRSLNALPFSRIALLCLTLSTPLLARAEAEPCTPVFRMSECAGYLEAALMRAHPKLFARQDGTLKLHLADGQVRAFVDVPANEMEDNSEQQVSYALLQFFPEIGYALIDATYWEGGTYFLVDIKTGATTDVGGEVALSPDGRRFAVANVDIEAEFTDNMLAVYRVTGDGLVSEFLESPEKWGASDVLWEGNDVVRFSRNYWGGADTIQKKTQRLRRVAEKPKAVWEIE
jgi:hypothetical protein